MLNTCFKEWSALLHKQFHDNRCCIAPGVKEYALPHACRLQTTSVHPSRPTYVAFYACTQQFLFFWCLGKIALITVKLFLWAGLSLNKAIYMYIPTSTTRRREPFPTYSSEAQLAHCVELFLLLESLSTVPRLWFSAYRGHDEGWWLIVNTSECHQKQTLN